MDGELKKIKKIYGEDFAKLCRTHFPRILEEEGLLLKTLTTYFAPSRSLYEDLISQDKVYDFKGFIFCKAGIGKYEPRDTDKTPEELFESVGYKMYRCKSNADLRAFKKYYEPDELLCTFRDPRRVFNHDVFFVVHEDVDSIHRKDFTNPEREDRYGTSVMSLQFDKYDGSLSIKNRYNHTVHNPDATYCNDMELICPGLTDSFVKFYGIVPLTDYSGYDRLHLGHYIQASDGKFYRYNTFLDGRYYCENNIIVLEDGSIKKYDKSQYELVGSFLIDKSEKTITNLTKYEDSFVDVFEGAEKIDVENLDGGGRKIIVTKKDKTYFSFTVGKHGQIISYENEFQTEVGDKFLYSTSTVETVSLPNVKKIGDFFMSCNSSMTSIDLPKVEEVGNKFLYYQNSIENVSMPSLKKTGELFLPNATSLKELHLPSLEETQYGFMCCADKLESFEAPKLKKVGDSFLARNRQLTIIDLPSLEETGSDFMLDSSKMKYVYFPKLRIVGDKFMAASRHIESIALPSARIIGNGFLQSNEIVSEMHLPSAEIIGDKFMNRNLRLREVSLPKIEVIGRSFLYLNKKVRSFYAPKLRKMGPCGLFSNRKILNLDLPEAEILGDWTLYSNKRVRSLNVPKLRLMGYNFLTSRGKMRKIRVSNAKLLPEHIKAFKIEDLGVEIIEPGE